MPTPLAATATALSDYLAAVVSTDDVVSFLTGAVIVAECYFGVFLVLSS